MARTERRVVSVLFADLVGFTSLAELLDPEDVALLQDRYFAGARAAVTAAGGVVEKFVGDAVMAVFGVPEVHDDDATRAVRAGLAIVGVVDSVGAGLDLPSASLRVRVGVNTGEVVVTFDEDAPGSWRLSGDTVNSAARFQSAAAPGSVLVGADTALAVAPAFVTLPAGDLSLKGKSAVVPAWRIVEARPAPSRVWALHGLHAATLGRDAELGLLDAALRRASAGRHEAILVVAPPGVGKTRLVFEFRGRARSAGSPVWAATASDQGAALYDPVARLLREALGPVAGDDAAGLRRRVLDRLAASGLTGPRAELGADHTVALLAGSSAPLGADAVDLWASWTAVLDAAPSGEAPVWIVEDVHLASPDLRRFLAHAVSMPYRPGRLVVLTARPTLVLAGAEASLGPVDVVNLEPLGEDDARRLVASLVGEGVLPAELEDTVAAASGGNPLFVEELLRSWVQAGALRRTERGTWELVGASDLAVPSTVRAIYLGQLFALPQAPRTVVETGSVPGTTFPAGALPVLGVDEPGHALDFLTGSGLLAGPHADAVDLASYTYRHALLRDAAYGALPRARRTQLHARFADWVAETVPAEQAAEIVGMHLLTAYEEASPLGPSGSGGPTRAELAERASAWLERAGDLAIASAPNRAAELFSLAVQLTDPERVDDGVRRQLRFAEALRRAGRLQDAVTVFGEAGLMAEDFGDSAACLAEAAVGYEDALFESRLPRSHWGETGIALLERALAGAEAGSGTQARLLAALGRARSYGGDLEAGARLSAEALEVARHSGDDGSVAYARMGMRASQSAPERLAERLAAAGELVEAAARAGDTECELEGSRLHFVDLLEAGDMAAADAAQRRAEEAIDALRRPLYLWYPAMWQAMRALFTGDFPAAERMVEAFREEGSRWRYRDVELVHAVQFLQLAVDLGRPERALPVIESVAGVEPERVLGVEASFYAHLGRMGEAQARLDRVGEHGFAAVPEDQSRSYVLALCADAASLLDDHAAAGRLMSLLEPWAGHNIVLGSGAVCLGSSSLFLGMAARTAGDAEGAARLLESAVAMNTAMGARPAAARAGLELACTLWELGRREEAQALAGRVRADARSLGMVEVVVQLDELWAAA